jgi:hypothetical protein
MAAGLKPAARAFVKSVFAVLAERADAYEEGPDDLARWTSRGGAYFALAPRQRSADEWCLSRELRPGSFPDVPERARFRAALAQDSRISPLLGELVGTGTRWRTVDEDDLDRSLLWTVWQANRSLRYTDAGFDRGYRAWVAETLAREEPLLFLAPLVGIDFAGEIELPSGVVIGQLRDDEIETLLSVGFMQTFGLPDFVTVSTGQDYARNWRFAAGSRAIYLMKTAPKRSRALERYPTHLSR